MTYQVTITSSDGTKHTYECGGTSDQDALIYAGKIVEENADEADPEAKVAITKDGDDIGPTATVAEMIKKAV